MNLEQEILADIKFRCGVEIKPYNQSLAETSEKFELTEREVETLVLEDLQLPIIETTDDEIAARLAATEAKR